MVLKKITVLITAVFLTVGTAYADYSSDLEALIMNNLCDDYVPTMICSIGVNTFIVGDKMVELKSAPILYDGNTLINPSELVGFFGAEIYLSDDKFVLKQNSMTVVGKVGSNKLFIDFDNGDKSESELPLPVILINDTLLVPLRAFVEEVFAGSVIWNENKQEIILMRDYQSRRIIVGVNDSFKSIEIPSAKEKITDGKGVWVIQFENDTPDLLIKRICSYLKKNNADIKYAIPDIVM